MPRYKLTIEYNGTGLAGWQRQKTQATVQQHIEEAVSKFFNTDERFVVQCSGRTDAGVHAYGQIAHVDLPQEREAHAIAQGVSYHIATSQIAITKAEKVADNFNARFDAKKRYYKYRIINRRTPLVIDRNLAWQMPEPLDAQAMHDAAQVLVGTHNFQSFRDSDCQAKSPVKTILSINISRQNDEITTELEAYSFLHHQVRIIMGCLRKIGNGQWDKAKLQEVLDAQNRKVSGPTAPACGLYFMQVDF
ncbi:MAG: tRNA pseudouridine(38-40) synthase TruA [Rickettsiales bacterium]|nr:tRNA pseudouridine(38-40) synthase TruA [Rickettsiales bacterium]